MKKRMGWLLREGKATRTWKLLTVTSAYTCLSPGQVRLSISLSILSRQRSFLKGGPLFAAKVLKKNLQNLETCSSVTWDHEGIGTCIVNEDQEIAFLRKTGNGHQNYKCITSLPVTMLLRIYVHMCQWRIKCLWENWSPPPRDWWNKLQYIHLLPGKYIQPLKTMCFRAWN